MSGVNPAPTHTPNQFRTDIEGLRAVAVGAVLLFHAGYSFAGGGYVGVDVFFVISGFLITNLLLKEVEKSGSVSLRRFYARRIRRLLPASVVALIFTALVTWVAIPINRWADTAGDLIASSFYVVNWRLAARSVDYLGAESSASPVQHFWSLSVEEQFYFVWPVLIVACALLAGKRRLKLRPAIGAGLGIVGLASLGYSIWYTSVSPGSAYFVTTTRMWELAIGAAVALALPAIRRVPGRTAGGLAFVGVLMVGWAVVAFGSTTAFPSYTALLPTVGTAAVIVAGVVDDQTLVHRWLSVPVAQFVGKLSYSLYLYHWPIIVGLAALVGELNPLIGTIGVALSFAPAYISYRFVESPLRTSTRFVNPPSRGLRYGVALTVVGALGGLSIFGLIELRERDTVVVAPAPTLDTGVVESGPPQGSLPIAGLGDVDIPDSLPDNLLPPLTSVSEDNASVYELGCHQNQRLDGARMCSYGSDSGPTVVLVGDSHAAQWVPAMEVIAAQQGWHFVSFSKSACPFGLMTVGLDGGTYDSCLAWNENVIDRIVDEINPDLVISTSSTTNLPVNDDGSLPERSVREAMYEAGLTEAVNRLADHEIEVVLLADTPRPGRDIPECLATEESLLACTADREVAITAQLQKSVAMDLGLTYVDMINFICTPTVCPPVVDNVIVWRDDGHLTATYAASLASALFVELPDV